MSLGDPPGTWLGNLHVSRISVNTVVARFQLNTYPYQNVVNLKFIVLLQ